MTDSEAMEGPRFCSECGRSLQPLEVPHVQRRCEQCPKTIYVVERRIGGGGGVRIHAGDKFTIPAGWITMSLDPSQSTAKLTRHAVAWYVTRILYSEAVVTDVAELDELLTRFEEQAAQVLQTSERVGHLDLESEEDGPEAWEILSEDKGSIEWWALVEGVMGKEVRDHLTDGDTAQAVVSALQLQAARTMLIFKRSLEEPLWVGYRHSRNVYDIAASTARTPDDAELIQALRPAFEKLPEDVLHAWVEGDADIGPKLNVTQLDERLLKALAKYHLDQFAQRRREEEMRAHQRDATTKNRLQGAGVAVSALGALFVFLKGVGWL